VSSDPIRALRTHRWAHGGFNRNPGDSPDNASREPALSADIGSRPEATVARRHLDCCRAPGGRTDLDRRKAAQLDKLKSIDESVLVPCPASGPRSIGSSVGELQVRCRPVISFRALSRVRTELCGLPRTVRIRWAGLQRQESLQSIPYPPRMRRDDFWPAAGGAVHCLRKSRMTICGANTRYRERRS